MAEKIKTARFDDSFAIHQHYIDIINCVPDIVYWIDIDCNLKGCNLNFVKLLGLKSPKDISDSPYEQMLRFTPWSKERIDAFRLDDMRVIFSGEAQFDIEEAPVYNKEDKAMYYSARRIPLLDKNHHVTGLVVVLTDITAKKNLEAKVGEKTAKKNNKPVKHHTIEEPNVLMVEDNAIAQKVEEALLSALHCHVDIAESGDMALKLFDPGKYDMVFMDIGLEDTSGYMVAKKIRELEKKTKFHVPIIALTSYKANIIKNDCKDYFMDGVLSKPLTSEQAEQLIKHFVHHQDIPVQGLESASDEG